MESLKAATISQEGTANLEEAIQSFEAAQTLLRRRRASASADVIRHIDHSLELNERTLASLRRALLSAKQDTPQAG
jgi:hypothetical protein